MIRFLQTLLTVQIISFCQVAAYALPKKPCLASCLGFLIREERAVEKDRKTVLELFQKRTLHESPERFLTLVNRSGKTFMVKAVGYIDGTGGTLAKVMLEDGYAAEVDLAKVRSIRISDESRDLWMKKQEDFLKHLRTRTLHQSDAQYLTLDSPESEGAVMVRVVGYDTVNDEVLPLIMHTEGYTRILEPDELVHAFSSIESKNIWLGIPGEHGPVHVRKSVSELPLKRKDLVDRAGLTDLQSATPFENAQVIRLGKEPIDPNAPADFEGVLLHTGPENERITQLAKSLDEKMNVIAIYSREANEAYQSAGFSLRNAKISDESGTPIFENQEILNLSKASSKGQISSTEIHEIGHAKTNQNITKGKPDPLAIQYRAHPGTRLPGGADYGINMNRDFYHEFSSADESRQHAFNFHNAVHQRVTSEVIMDFSKTKKIEVQRVFGVNLQNFHSSMKIAMQTLENLAVLNLRHTELALYAQRKIGLDFSATGIRGSSFEFILHKKGSFAEVTINTAQSKVTVPVVGNAYLTLIKPLIGMSSKGQVLLFSKHPEVIPKLKTYLDQYLLNQIELLDQQFKAIEQSKVLLLPLSRSPFALMDLAGYLKHQNTFTRVKSSVNYSPKKVESLLWVDPELNPPK